MRRRHVFPARFPIASRAGVVVYTAYDMCTCVGVFVPCVFRVCRAARRMMRYAKMYMCRLLLELMCCFIIHLTLTLVSRYAMILTN